MSALIVEQPEYYFNKSTYTQFYFDAINKVQVFNMAPVDFTAETQYRIVAVWHVKLK